MFPANLGLNTCLIFNGNLAKGAGISGGFSPTLSFGVGSTTFTDAYSSINPNVFNGIFIYKGISYLFSGSKTTTVHIGGASGNMSTDLGAGLHTNPLSFEIIRGDAVVNNVKWESCCG